MYETVIIIATMFLALITNGRIGYVLGQRWGISTTGNEPPLWELFCAIVGCVPFYWISQAGLQYGTIGGLIVLLGTIPFSGFVWIFIVGTNKAIERILNNLLKKVE